MNKKQVKKLSKNLPQIAGILGRERYLNSSVLIPLIKKDKEYFLLFQKRAATIRQGGDICFPGGKVDKTDKNFKHTALRETKEELGIKKKHIKILGRLDTLVTRNGIIVEPFVGIIKNKTLKKMQINVLEVEKTLLIPLSFFKETQAREFTLEAEIKPYSKDEAGNIITHFPSKELNLPLHYQSTWKDKSYKVWVYEYEGEIIWGLTAVLINELVKKY